MYAGLRGSIHPGRLKRPWSENEGVMVASRSSSSTSTSGGQVSQVNCVEKASLVTMQDAATSLDTNSMRDAGASRLSGTNAAPALRIPRRAT